MDREQVISQMDNWEKRLSDLVETLQEWYARLPDASFKEFLIGSVLQVTEGMMKDFEIHPRMLPHCAVLYNRNRLSFVPGPLWILGANGRVNVTTNKRQFVLINLESRENNPADWHIVTSQMQGTYRPFTEQMFKDLVEREEVAVA